MQQCIEININPDGTIHCGWWTPEAAEIVCSICGNNGWQRFGPISIKEINPPDELKEKMKQCLNCSIRNPYCG
jgi:hypothetical protein